jgi:enediyne biosynthesis protein E4
MQRKLCLMILTSFKRQSIASASRSMMLATIMAVMTHCNPGQKTDPVFQEISSEESGITFQNMVSQDGENNVLTYPYYFNGGGVAIGDINNDGLEDVYFTGNQVSNKLYLNKGNFKFEDITVSAGVEASEGWKTGVTMADINQDGWLDIYVCRSAMADSSLRQNLLFLNNGNLTFTEKADAYGIADNSYSTQGAFFDFDKDGDLDLFVLNHSLPQYAGFNNMLVNNKRKTSTKFHSKLFENDDGRFRDVSEKAGIINNVLSFGLGIAVSDLNSDGWTDIYVSNDFNEEDYLYMNNRDGTFTNVISQATGHVSLFSMGSDIADVNNDARADIFTLDMLPESNERIKLSSGDDNYDKYNILVKAGFHHQSMRNMLQLNNGDGTFSEVGQLMGISNTDWSWAALFADFDGDGWKDLFISNGYEKDYTNMQFLKFTMDEKIRARQTGTQPSLQQIVSQMPSIQVGNFLFKNNGDFTFSKKTGEWGITRAFKSNGAAYSDLDNDGDLDLLINTLNEKTAVFRNAINTPEKNSFLKVDLRTNNRNVDIVGSKLFVYNRGKVQYQEFSPVRGFQSCMYGPLVFGSAGLTVVDSIRIVWPDNKTQLLTDISTATGLAPKYSDANQLFVYPRKEQPLFSEKTLISWTHKPVDTIDFKRQLLLPKIYSYSGPKTAKGDVNHDGLDDLYVCGARHQAGALFLQLPGGSFSLKKNAAFEADREHQDEDAIFFDGDGDNDLDLYVVSGGYLFDKNHPMLQDRYYRNDGNGNFARLGDAVPSEKFAGSCVATLDVDGDKDMDLFVGSRFIPGEYPLAPQSMFLINDGNGKFSEQLNGIVPGLKDAGMICGARSADVNNDGKTDLLVAGEWTSLKLFVNHAGKLADESDKWFSAATNGWWNCILTDDFDGDGDQDMIAGNYGFNTQFKASADEPATLVYKDFDHDGNIDPFFCYYINGRSYPYASRDEALGQVPFLKQRYPDYISYANEPLEKIFREEELKGARTLHANNLGTSYFENKGTHFEKTELPIQAQFSPVYALTSFDVDADGDKDLVMAGNETYARVRIGKTDANRGFLFLNDSKGHFRYVPQTESGFNFNGDVRSLLFVSSQLDTFLVGSQTGGTLKSYLLKNK